MKNLVTIALIGLGVWLATKIAAALSLRLSPGAISFAGSSFVIGLNITNTSTFPIAYNNFTGTVYINGQSVGTVYDNTAQDIIANGVTNLSLIFTPLPGTLIQDIVSEMGSGGASQQITIKGLLRAENIPIPITENYNTPDFAGAVNQVSNLLSKIGL